MAKIGTQTPTYDQDGNVLNDYLNSYSWDVYGRPITIDGVGITYDALGRMVEQNKSGAYTQVYYSPSGLKMLYMNGNTFVKDTVPLPGGASEWWTPAVNYYRHSDWLGSSRLPSTVSRTIYYDGAYGPFGEPYAGSGTTDLNFTGMNQDISPNVYDFPAREYGIQGRWPSPDPAGLAAVNPMDPQTWNRYAYVRNSPLEMIDPLGLDGCPPGTEGVGSSGTCVSVSGGSGSSIDLYWILHMLNVAGWDEPYLIFQGPHSGGSSHGASTGFKWTLSVRQPGQTFKGCMAVNANTYSIGGSVELTGDVAFGKNTSISTNPFVSAVAGNSINAFLFGSTNDATGTMAATAPGLVSTAMGSITTFGRSTSTITEINLASAGGLPRALTWSSAGVKSVLGSVGRTLSLGLSFAERTSVDAAFTAAESINCAIPQSGTP